MRYLDAVRSQGRNIRACCASIATTLAGANLLPWRNENLSLTGMGASYNAILAVAPSYWKTGAHASCWLAADLMLPGAHRNLRAVIAVTQSGRSPEVVSCLARLPAHYPKLVLTDDPRSPAAAEADLTVPLALLDDSAVRTLGYTGTLVALGLVRDALTGTVRTPDWELVACEVERLVPDAERFAERVLPAIRASRSFDVAGSAAHLGSAAQGALLLREVARLPSSPYETHQYLHGPLEVVEPGMTLILLGGAREAKLATSVAGQGVTVILVTTEEIPERDGLFVFPLPRAGDSLIPVFDILPLQMIALALAEELGVPTEEFRHHQDDTKVA
jgi:glucosamine--fructose-6-phosphate aminotransferase (isomerizing)